MSEFKFGDKDGVLRYKFRGINTETSTNDDLTMWVELHLEENTVLDVVKIIDRNAHLYDKIQIMAKKDHAIKSCTLPVSYYQEHLSNVANHATKCALINLKEFMRNNVKMTDIDYDYAQKIIKKRLSISNKWLRKKLATDHDTAVAIMMNLQIDGVLSSPKPNGKREVLLRP